MARDAADGAVALLVVLAAAVGYIYLCVCRSPSAENEDDDANDADEFNVAPVSWRRRAAVPRLRRKNTDYSDSTDSVFG